jgi:hypothetical protein
MGRSATRASVPKLEQAEACDSSRGTTREACNTVVGRAQGSHASGREASWDSFQQRELQNEDICGGNGGELEVGSGVQTQNRKNIR